MKKTNLLLLVILATLFACQDDTVMEQDEMNAENKELIIDEALQSAIVDDIMADIDLYSALGEGLKSAEIEGGCPTVTTEYVENKWPRTVVIDYGEGCEKNGKVKEGKMIIEKSDKWWTSGAVRRVTFDGFKIDGKWIGGVKEIVNKTEEEGNPTFLIEGNIVMEWMKNDTTEMRVKRTFSKTQEWIIGFRDNEIKAEFIINGTTTIEKRVNTTEKTITKVFSDMKLAAGCRFPQAGVTSFEVNTYDNLSLVFELDYGTEGAASDKCQENCDCYATLSWYEGETKKSEDIDLSVKWWEKARETEEANN